jgi:hypothetical protein
MRADEFATHMREVVFAGHNVVFAPAQAARHKFGIRLIRALTTALNVAEACGLHAMLIWTISVSMSARGGSLDVCVACLMLCVKMQDMVAVSISRFVTTCRQMFQSREHVSMALEWTLQNETVARDAKVSHLTAVLKMLDSADLVREISNLTCMHLKYAEIFLLFTSFHGQWYRYLIELYEYVRSKTHGMQSETRLRVILDVCQAQDA